MKTSNQIIAIAGALLMPLCFVTDARSDPPITGSFVPGLVCRYYAPLGDDVFLDPGGYSANGLKNTSNQDVYISCPIVKDYSSDTEGAWIVLNKGDASCQLYRRDVGGFQGGKHSPSEIIKNRGWYLYTWEWSGGLVTQEESLAIYCRLPPGGVVNNYYHQEIPQ